MGIAFFGVKPEEQKYIQEHRAALGHDARISFFETVLDKNHVPPQTDFEVISVFVDSTLNIETLSRFPNLKHIATRSTGFDHIDVPTCTERGVSVSNVPSYGEHTVAEFAFGLLLTLSRKIFTAVDRIREISNFSFEGLQGFDLKGKTLGVIGTGRIGRHVIKIAHGFEMKVVAFDLFPNQALAEEFMFEYKPFEEVLKASDIVTIHVPYTKETHNLFNARAISFMKKGAYLINTSRGSIVETMALVRALKEGRLGGAGLDVLEEEGVVKDEMGFILREGGEEGHDLKIVLANHLLFDMPNVVVTPHTAFNTKEALLRILDTTLANIRAFESGKPVNLVS